MRLPRTVAAAAVYGSLRGLLTGRSDRVSRRTGLLAALIAVLALSAVAGLMTGVRSLAGDPNNAGAELQLFAQEAGPLVVFSEFGPTSDTIWAVDPNDPAARIQIARIPHAPDFRIFPSLSPDSAQIAYTVLPADPPRGWDGTAELWLLKVANGSTQRLAQGIDLRITPVWSPASDAVIVRRADQQTGRTELLRVERSGALAVLAGSADGLFPIDLSPDGAWLYYATVSAAGTDLARVSATGGGAAETLAHLSDGVARDWRLSPDGSALAYLAQVRVDGGFTFAAQVLDLTTGGVDTPVGVGVAQFSPVWRQGGLTIGSLDPGSGNGAPLHYIPGAAQAQAVSPLPAAPALGAGFDVPLSWSPDSDHLAVRAFQGVSPADPGPSHLVIAGTDGRRHQLSPISDSVIAGWLETAP